MGRRYFLAVAAVAATSCGRGGDKGIAVPAALPGGWTRRSIEAVGLDQAPELARRLGAKRVTLARFDGPSPLVATYYTMGADSAAFELVQKWKPEPGEMFFSRGPIFVIVAAAGMDARSLRPIVDAVEKELVR